MKANAVSMQPAQRPPASLPWALLVPAAILGALAVLGGGTAAGGFALAGTAMAAAAAFAGLTGWAVVRGAAAHRAAAAASPAAADGEPTGVALMSQRVLPVWRRQIEATRELSDSGIGGLLASFNQLNTVLSAAAVEAAPGPASVGTGSTDEMLDTCEPLIEKLLQPVHELRSARGVVLSELEQLSAQMRLLVDAGKELDRLARHARLVAMNASIEANRAGQSQGVFGAVAREVLDLSNTASASAGKLLDGSSQAGQRLSAMLRRIELDTQNDETLRLQLRLAARSIVASIAGELSQALAGSRALQDTSRQLQGNLDEVLQGFQFQDRLSQMLDIVNRDMGRFVDWLDTGTPATRADVDAWLKRLDDSYTMEQQRSTHLGTAQIDRAAAVEFF